MSVFSVIREEEVPEKTLAYEKMGLPAGVGLRSAWSRHCTLVRKLDKWLLSQGWELKSNGVANLYLFEDYILIIPKRKTTREDSVFIFVCGKEIIETIVYKVIFTEYHLWQLKYEITRITSKGDCFVSKSFTDVYGKDKETKVSKSAWFFTSLMEPTTGTTGYGLIRFRERGTLVHRKVSGRKREFKNIKNGIEG